MISPKIPDKFNAKFHLNFDDTGFHPRILYAKGNGIADIKFICKFRKNGISDLKFKPSKFIV